MRTGSLLCLQSTEGLTPLGAFNQPVHRSYAQIRAALLNELGQRYADYFARPDVDGDGHRIGWVASTVGEPRRWVDMSPEEQQRLEPIKQEIQNGFGVYRAKLDAAGENTPQNNFGKVLAQAARVPSPEYLYFIGDQPVLAFWGFKNTSLREGIDPLRLSPGGMLLSGETKPVIGGGTRAANGPAKRGWPWWLWLLLLLLLLLLLFALWWWWSRPAIVGRIQPPAPIVQREQPPRPIGPDQRDVTRAGPGDTRQVGPGGVVDRNVVPGDEADRRVGQGNNLNVAPSDRTRTPGINSAPDQLTGPNEQRADTDHGPNQRQDQPESQQPNPDLPQKQQQAEIPKDLPPLPPIGSEASSDPLKLPSDMQPGPAGFMSGSWQSRSGLQINGKPAEEVYRFNGQGQGEITLRTRDGTIECRGPAQANVDPGGHLAITEAPSLGCNNGSSVPGAITQCDSGGATASCVGTNQTDGSKFRVQMQSLGKK
jgi:hypothetical protein